MCAVPLIIEKIYKTSIMPTIEKSRILSWMKDHTPCLLYRLVGKRLYSTFGGKLKFFGIGGSKLDPVVEDFLKRAHFPYAIGYGLTETAPLITNACVGKTVVGSIGVPAHNVEVKLMNVNPETGEGEIYARGDNVMLGYYKDPSMTLSPRAYISPFQHHRCNGSEKCHCERSQRWNEPNRHFAGRDQGWRNLYGHP